MSHTPWKTKSAKWNTDLQVLRKDAPTEILITLNWTSTMMSRVSGTACLSKPVTVLSPCSVLRFLKSSAMLQLIATVPTSLVNMFLNKIFNKLHYSPLRMFNKRQTTTFSFILLTTMLLKHCNNLRTFLAETETVCMECASQLIQRLTTCSLTPCLIVNKISSNNPFAQCNSKFDNTFNGRNTVSRNINNNAPRIVFLPAHAAMVTA